MAVSKIEIEILDIIGALEDLIDTSSRFPLTGKCMVDRDEMEALIDELRMKLPDDIKTAEWIRDERDRIIEEARNEAAFIVQEAQEKALRLVDENEITIQASEKATEMVEEAKQQSRDYRRGAAEYAGSVMQELEGSVEVLLKEIKANREELESING